MSTTNGFNVFGLAVFCVVMGLCAGLWFTSPDNASTAGAASISPALPSERTINEILGAPVVDALPTNSYNPAQVDAVRRNTPNGQLASSMLTFNRGWLDPVFTAIAAVETGGEADPDASRGKAGERGRYQIMQDYWTDSDLDGTWSMCHNTTYAEMVMVMYFMRYEPTAFNNRDFETLCKLHHGGPNWRHRPHVEDYWQLCYAQMRR